MSSRDTRAGCNVRTCRLLLSQEQNVPTYFFTTTKKINVIANSSLAMTLNEWRTVVLENALVLEGQVVGGSLFCGGLSRREWCCLRL